MAKRQRYELMNRFISSEEARATRARIARSTRPVSLMDSVIDERWAQQQGGTQAPKSYFDYFFSAQDIRVHVAEVGDDPEFGDLPIYNLGFNVSQEKTPVYGFQSYTYDGVLRGTRLVTGSFTLVTKYPNYMKDLLTKAATNRVANSGSLADDYPSPSTWREDDKNIDQYWGKHLDVSATSQGGTEWSVHPPFSLVVIYGVQNTSLDVNNINSIYSKYEEDNPLFFDRNQRLVEGFNPDVPSRIIIDGCELTGVDRAYAAEAPLVAEKYEFFARDIFIPQPTVKTTGKIVPTNII